MMQIPLDLAPRTWGGRRANAGRKRAKGAHDPMHRARPEHKARHPVHVVLRTRRDVGRLRRRPIYDVVHAALRTIAVREAFRVVHLSIQHNHLHLLVEAADKDALSRGMQALAIATARGINRVQQRRGKVFAFRYHATAITNPRQARNALAYVLNNWRRHREDLVGARERAALLDPYASGFSFAGWRRVQVLPGGQLFPVARPRTWLLATGWLRYGALDPRAVPGRI